MIDRLLLLAWMEVTLNGWVNGLLNTMSTGR